MVGNTNICQTFQLLAMHTWINMKDGYQSGLVPGEESTTDWLLLQLWRNHPNEIRIKRYKKQTEEPKTGADWMWVLTDGSFMLKIRVQAKKLETKSLTYSDIDRFVGTSSDKQIEVLIRNARKTGCIPLYCFYNYWDPLKFTSGWNCKTYPKLNEFLGCTIALAEKVKPIAAKKTPITKVDPIALPWMCLVCCTGYLGNLQNTLPNRAHSILKNHAGSGIEIPGPIPYDSKFIEELFSELRPIGKEKGHSDTDTQDDRLAGAILLTIGNERE
jgi:hypothetical protein